MDTNVTRVTRVLRNKVIIQPVGDNSVSRPNTPQTDLDVPVNVTTPARRTTRQNSRDLGTPIVIPSTTPSLRTTRRNSIAAEASPAVIASPVRRSKRRLNSTETPVKQNQNQIYIIDSVVREEDEYENANEITDDKENNKRATRSSSKSPKDGSVKENSDTMDIPVRRGKTDKFLSRKINLQTPESALERNSDSDSDDAPLIRGNSKSNSKSPNMSKHMKENSIQQNEQSIDSGKTKKNQSIDQSLNERQRMKSVTFNNSDDNLNSPKIYPKTPICSKSKSIIDGTNFESSKEFDDNSFKHINNSKNDRSIGKDHNEIDKNNSTKSIQNENSNSILNNTKNLENLNSNTPYKELEQKVSGIISSSTPININLKNNPVVRLAKIYKSVVDKSNQKLVVIPSKFSTSWDQAIRGNANNKIDKLNDEKNNVEEEIIKKNDSPKIKKSKKVIPSDNDEEEDDYEEIANSENDNIEKNEFIDDEADEMDGEDSLDEEEKQYLKDNEIPENGEIIGSEDTDVEEEQELEEENDSFIVSDNECDDDKLLSTDSEELLLEDEKVKKVYKRLQVADSDDDDDADKSNKEKNNKQKNMNDRSFTIDKSISIINISTDVDEMLSNCKEIDNEQKNITENNNQNISRKNVSNQNSSKRKSLNISRISGIDVISDDSEDNTVEKSLNISQNNKSVNRSIKIEKQTPIRKNSKSEILNDSKKNKQFDISSDDDNQINNKSELKSPKNRNTSIKSISNVDDESKTSDSEIKKKLNKSSSTFMHEKLAISSEDNEDINVSIINKSLVKSPRNASINKSIVIEENNEKGKVLNKSINSPKIKNISFNKSIVFLKNNNSDSETEEQNEEFNRKSKLINSPKNRNSSIINNVNQCEEYEENEVSQNIFIESPINSNSPKRKSLIMSADSDNQHQVINNSLLKLPKNLNNSRKTEEIEDHQSNEKPENNDSDSNEEDDKDYVPPENENESESNSSTNSEDVEELKVELEKINQEQNKCKNQLSYSFTSGTECRLTQMENKRSASFTTTENFKISNEEDNDSEQLNKSLENHSTMKDIQNINQSDSEDFEKLKSNEFKLKLSNRKSMMEMNDNGNLILPSKKSKKSRHSLGSTYVEVHEEVFEDLREKLNKSNKTVNINNNPSSCDEEAVLHNEEKQPENYTDFNKNLDGKNQNTVTTDCNFNQVTHILNRCDEILEAANRAKMEDKLRNKNMKPKNMKTKKRKFKENNDSSNTADEIDIQLKDAAIAKALKHKEIILSKKNSKKNTDKSSSLPVEVIEGIEEDTKFKIQKPSKDKKKNSINKINSDSGDAGEETEQIEVQLKEAAIAKALKHQEIILRKKNSKLNLQESASSTNRSRLLPVEILEAIDHDTKFKKKNSSKDSQLKHSKNQSESLDLSDMENKPKSANKLKRKPSTDDIQTTSNTEKNHSRNVVTNIGMFIEQPITPPPKNKKRKIISKQELPFGTVYEEPITPESKKIFNGFKESAMTPKAIGYKVRSILSAGQKEPPTLHNVTKNLHKRKRKHIPEPVRSLPKTTWANAAGSFVVEKLEKKIDLDESIATDFYVMPLEIKKSSKNNKNQQFFGINSNALEFKTNAMMNSKVRRETSKEMLQRKERQNIYKKF